MALLFKSGRGSRGRTPATDNGERIYAIGDIHGRIDLLRELLAKIEEHQSRLKPVRSTHLVLLGDLVDRGPDSAKVLSLVYNVQKHADRVIVLQGNHEQMMLRALDGERGMLRAWMRIGGADTLRSFGLDPPASGDDESAFIELAKRKIPIELLDWMRELPLTAASGDFFFCHAGVRPGVSLHRQSRADLLWIRDEFLGDPNYHGAVIVHGHSIAAEVEILPNRIGIDTGAYQTEVLTALYLEGTKRETFSTGVASVDAFAAAGVRA